LRRVCALVSELWGPVESCALRRFASICFCVAMVISVLCVNSFLRLGDTMVELSWTAKSLKNIRKIVVTEKRAVIQLRLESERPRE
jgi:hypothetical protein